MGGGGEEEESVSYVHVHAGKVAEERGGEGERGG